MDKFIYVFSAADRDKLLGGGFLLLKEDAYNTVYIFAADDRMRPLLDEISYLTGNTLTY